ncbi:MAG: ATP-binding cassette domain-containing protein [Chloroflexi bacterium]|nr:ATP-binding cassette domain-containing protein [Chloroflexota bacterium]MCL5275554.1 ATP-binding cassette domain-containing protein [Chloroflexota bacterium]
MSIITGTAIGKSFGAFDVFTELNFSIARGDKIALVGPNGCGKTTLLKVIAGEDEPSAGALNLARGTTVGYLAQTAEESNEHTVWQEMVSAFSAVNALAAQMRQLEQDMLDPARSEQALEKYGAVEHQFEMQGGYEIDTRIRRVLGGLNFSDEDHERPLSHLSGGQRVRAALAKLLLLSPDVLMLDEPTNHLDTGGVEWLEAYLQDWDGTLVVVSHDRYFLDEVCDRVWEMGGNIGGRPNRLETYRGGYTDYAMQRAERRERQLKEYEQQQEVIGKESEYIRRNIAGQNVLQAKGRLKRLNRMERLEKPIEARAMSLRLNSGQRSGNIVLETHNLLIGYAGARDDASDDDADAQTTLFRCPNLQLLRTERAALIGPNGTGKTTFLKTICGTLDALEGSVRIGANVQIGYFAQAHEGLNLEHTVLEELMSARDDMLVSQARNMLGRFLFSGDDAFKKVGMLSGGERGRVALAKLTLQGANFLLLDEPTNHLDIPSQEILTEALNNFDGTLLLVSHDRYLIAALATQIWSLERTGRDQTRMSLFRGTYDAWIEEKLEAARVKEKQQKEQLQKARAQVRSQDPGAGAARKVEREMQNRLAQTEQRIAALEDKLNELNQQIQQAGGDYAQVRDLSLEYQQTEHALAEAWTELEKIG